MFTFATPADRVAARHCPGHGFAVTQVLERGDIHFFFRPTVQPADAREPTFGVQSFFVVLSPAGLDHRRVRIGKKRMPARAGERLWARVERVGSFRRVLGDMLEDEHYTTKTRGERYQPAARPIARGTYAFVRHDDHTHFVYTVDHNEDVPDEILVPISGNHVVLFENTRGRAIWSAEGELDRIAREGEELVLVGIAEDHLGVEAITSP